MERDYEAEASKQGWKPQDEWEGDPDAWKPAKEFVEIGEKIDYRKSVKALEEKFEAVQTELAEAKQANQQFGQFFKEYQDREEKQKQKLIDELQKAKAQAIEEGDGKAFMNAENRIQELQTPLPQQDITPDARNFLSQNQWYNHNKNMTMFADGVAEHLKLEGYPDQSKAYFDELEKRVKDFFPDEFKNPNRERAGSVETDVTPAQLDSKEQTYENLPADAKQACDSFVKQGLMSQEDYVKAYEWETDNA